MIPPTRSWSKTILSRLDCCPGEMWGCRSDNFFASSHLLFVHLRYRHDDEGKHKHGEEEETTIDEYHSEKCIALQTKHFSRSATMSWRDRRWCGNFFSTLALAIRQSRALIKETDSLRGKSKIDRKTCFTHRPALCTHKKRCRFTRRVTKCFGHMWIDLRTQRKAITVVLIFPYRLIMGLVKADH